MGSEHGPKPAFAAAWQFVKKHKDVQIILVGKKTELSLLPSHPQLQLQFAEQTLSAEDSLVGALRKTDSSLRIALDLVKTKQAATLVSASATASFIALAYSVLGSESKPAFMPWVPARNGKGFVMLDVGASIEVNGEDLYGFAKTAHRFKEPRDLLDGDQDIVVCDGYGGNLTLKALEGAMKAVSQQIRTELKKPGG
ncbi:unnamed protein product [Didymodactylos carnosus]|uniref:phosphate acyltransferase n=1 Tax=Didymodactylos carnosus TaxID=1234261 RepID=A0A8S2CUP8_9BILA|nr:unnamed protein product [Didymodactylos carnosus]CAF3523981.1 unnamed protein product [Didymodactylos carnosus]